MQTKIDTKTKRMNLWLPAGRMRGRNWRQFGMDMYTLLYLKWITNNDLWYSTLNSAQFYVTTWVGRECGENGYMYMHGWVSLLSIEIIMTLVISYTPMQKKKKVKQFKYNKNLKKIKNFYLRSIMKKEGRKLEEFQRPVGHH